MSNRGARNQNKETLTSCSSKCKRTSRKKIPCYYCIPPCTLVPRQNLLIHGEMTPIIITTVIIIILIIIIQKQCKMQEWIKQSIRNTFLKRVSKTTTTRKKEKTTTLMAKF